MSNRLVDNLRGSLTVSLIVLNIVLWFIPILIGAVIKLLLPLDAVRRLLSAFLIACAENWITFNKIILNTLTPLTVERRGDTDLLRREWYLVISNHQTWVDVLALQYAFNRRVPFFKFFIKQQLIWVPFLGLAWWALDMPFMRRYSKSYLAAHPEKKGQDLETTRKACEKFQSLPTSVINFVEGTRSNPEKIGRKQSPYKYLLRPRSGGVAFALGAMGPIMHKMVDLTVFYPNKSFSFWDLCCGRLDHVIIETTVREIPDWIAEGSYATDVEFRQRFHGWMSSLWKEKDEALQRLHVEFGKA